LVESHGAHDRRGKAAVTQWIVLTEILG